MFWSRGNYLLELPINKAVTCLRTSVTQSIFRKHENKPFWKDNFIRNWKDILKLCYFWILRGYVRNVLIIAASAENKKDLYENNSTCHPVKIVRFPIQTLDSLIPRLLSVSMESGYIGTGTLQWFNHYFCCVYYSTQIIPATLNIKTCNWSYKQTVTLGGYLLSSNN